MINPKKTVAYIDGANLHKGITALGWKLDYKKFRVWLREKYGVQQAYLFIGLMPNNTGLYTNLQEKGYTLVFKEVVYDQAGKPKGNCDADLVVKAIQDSYEGQFDGVVLVASDGDYASLVKFLMSTKKDFTILSPAVEERCSVLLKRTTAPIVFIQDKKSQLQYGLKEKAPDADGTA